MEDSDGLMAVVAHGLLNSMAVIGTALRALDRPGPEVDQSQREVLTRLALEQTDHVISVLQDLMRSISPEVITALDALSMDR